MTPSSPRLGIFWFVPVPAGGSRVVELSKVAEEVPLIAGFRTLETGHAEHWPRVVRTDRSLFGVPYEAYPRGRANYIAEGDSWLLLVDAQLQRPAFLDVIIDAWALPRTSLRIDTDSHYRSTRSVDLPCEPYRAIDSP